MLKSTERKRDKLTQREIDVVLQKARWNLGQYLPSVLPGPWLSASLVRLANSLGSPQATRVNIGGVWGRYGGDSATRVNIGGVWGRYGGDSDPDRRLVYPKKKIVSGVAGE